MALALGSQKLHRLTVDDVARMLEAGVLTEDTPVELLEGMLVEMTPKVPTHTGILTRLDRWLLPIRLAGVYDVRIEQPLAVPDPSSLPEPDLAVVERVTDLSVHPTTALLVIEVAVTSQVVDTTVKPALYAAAGVPEYWVVDVPARRIEIRSAPAGGSYGSLEVRGPGDAVRPAGLELPRLDPADLLPGVT